MNSELEILFFSFAMSPLVTLQMRKSQCFKLTALVANGTTKLNKRQWTGRLAVVGTYCNYFIVLLHLELPLWKEVGMQACVKNYLIAIFMYLENAKKAIAWISLNPLL